MKKEHHQAIEEKDNQIQDFEFTNEAHQQKNFGLMTRLMTS